MWKPTVSVVMCTYNGAAFIKEQLDSILRQTYPIDELLIFDDASSDETASIIRTYCDKHPVIKFHQNPINIGFNPNFEQALKAATGEVIAIADQDDFWHPEKIERMITAWKEDTLLIYCDSFRFNGKAPVNVKSNPIYRRFEGKDPSKLFICNTISGHAILIKRRLIDLVLPFKKVTYYDWWMGVVAACNGGVSYVPEILVYQRIHQNNATVQKQSKSQKAAYRKIMLHHLYDFETVPNMSESDRMFVNKLSWYWSNSLNQPFYWPLFFFLLKHRTSIFWYKKRRIYLFSHLKHSFLMAKR